MYFGVSECSQLSSTLPFLLTLVHRVILLSVGWLCELIVLRWKCQRTGVTLKHTQGLLEANSEAEVEELMLHGSVCPLSSNKSY